LVLRFSLLDVAQTGMGPTQRLAVITAIHRTQWQLYLSPTPPSLTALCGALKKIVFSLVFQSVLGNFVGA
jgi:hypothetical protein